VVRQYSDRRAYHADLIVLRRGRQRAPNLTASDRLLCGFWSLFLGPERIRRVAIAFRPSTLLAFHQPRGRRRARRSHHDKIDVLLVNGDPNPSRPDLPPYGAGEASLKPMLAAIGNAIHDATGVRIRRVPFRRHHARAESSSKRLD
jgi:hypothetical protein